MKKNIKRFAAFAFGILAAIAITQSTKPTITSPDEPIERLEEISAISTTTILQVKPLQTPEQKAWMDKLITCESGGNPEALNPHDGGSRSVGILQFKDTTFAHYSKAYELGFTPEDIYDPEKQKIVAHHMLTSGLETHWMNCYRKINEDYPDSDL